MNRLAPINPLLPATPDMAWVVMIVATLVVVAAVIGLVVKARDVHRNDRDGDL